MKTLEKIVSKVEELIAVISFTAMTSITIVAVFYRYALSSPIIWSEELSRYLAVWGIMFGISIATRQSSHLGVDMLQEFSGEKVKKVLIIGSDIVLIITFAILTVLSAGFVASAIKLGNVSPILRIPFWIVYLALPIGFGLSTIRAIQVLVEYFKGIDMSEEVML